MTSRYGLTRIEWILGGLLIVLLLVVGVLAFLLWSQPRFTSPPNVPAAAVATPVILAQQTALSAEARANRAAAEWESDAVLYKASTLIPRGASNDMINYGLSSWTFTYYSASSNSIASIGVEENQANLQRNQSARTTLSPLAISGWKIDSPEAMRIFLNDGGDTFLSREGQADLIMELRTDTDSNRIEWFISLIAGRSGPTLSMTIDATSGDIIRKTESPAS